MNIRELNHKEVDYRSGVLLRDLIEVVEQLKKWMSTYDEALVPKSVTMGSKFSFLPAKIIS
jgi:hypothetical protein